MNKTRLLITSVGSLVATNLLEALTRIGRERFFVIGTNSEAEAANNFACDVAYQVPPAADGAAYRAALEEIGRTEDPELWIPARDDDVVELARLASERGLPGIALVGLPGIAEIICDKWLSYRFAVTHGLSVAPTANTFADAVELAENHGFPLIVKPRRGYGSKGARFVTDAAQLERALSLGNCVAQVVVSAAPDWPAMFPDPGAGWPLWYSYVDPGQYASQWMIAPDGRVIEIGATLNTMVCGRPERTVRVDLPALTETAGGYARELAASGWRGPLNVQCRKEESGNFTMFELAGRFAGGLGGREMVGIPEVETVFAAIFPERFARTAPPAKTCMVALKQPQTRGIYGDDISRLEEAGVWRRSS